jgi:acetolactate synthase-1/2/3 large subunit
VNGGQAVVAELRRHGVDRVFAVPGESYLAVLDALVDEVGVALVTCRHEAGAANMAEAYGKLTGQPGVCFVSRGPGATHASIACHTAQQDGTPMLLFIGDIARGSVGRESFQEVDFATMFAPLSKLVLRLDDPARAGEVLGRAFRVAASGRPGPVVVVLPEDVLVADAPIAASGSVPAPVSGPAFSAEQIRPLLRGAQRPLVVVGGSGWTAQAADDFRAFVEEARLPVAAAFRCQDILDNESPCYIGQLGFGTDPTLRDYAASADVVLAVGARLDSPTTGDYELWDPADQGMTLIHLFPDPEELGRVYQPAVGIACDAPAAAGALRALQIEAAPQWKESLHSLRAAYEAFRTPAADGPALDLAKVVAHLSAELGERAIITNGAGNYTGWVQRYFSFRKLGTYLGPRNGAMGYGVPAAIAAKLVRPEATVVAFAGDGCFMMAGHELATAVHHDVPVVVVVVNNGIYGTIRMHQEREYPARVSGTTLSNPDFVMLAQAYGCHHERVERTEQFAAAFARAVASGRPALIELRTDPDLIAPGVTVAALRGRAAGGPVQTARTE